MSVAAWAQTAPVNEVLFAITLEASTARDLQLYQAVLTEVFQKKTLSRYSKSAAQDFLLSRLAYREAMVFELTGEKNKITDAARKKMSEYTAEGIEKEAALIAKAQALIEVKEAQLKQRERFDT